MFRKHVSILLIYGLVLQPVQQALQPLSAAEAPARLAGLGSDPEAAPFLDEAGSAPVESGQEETEEAPALAAATAEEMGLAVSAGFADNATPSADFPAPWQGAPNVVYIGGGAPVNAGAIRLDNHSGAPLTIDRVEVDLQRANAKFSLWQGFTIPANGSAILTQTAPGNFDTSAYPIVPCGGTLPAGETRVPKITVTSGGSSVVLLDSAHVLDTGGFDSSCRGNESVQWRAIGTRGIEAPAGALILGPSESSGSGGSPVTLRAHLQDAGGAPLSNVTIDFRAVSGPNAGEAGEAVTDSQGNAQLTYVGTAQGADVLRATVANASGASMQSNDVTVTWETASCGPDIPLPPTGEASLLYTGGTRVQYSDPIELAGLLSDSLGEPAAGRTLGFSFHGQTFDAVTDATGIARVAVAAAVPPAEVPVTVDFAGGSGLPALRATQTVTVEREDVLLEYTAKTLLGTAVPQTVSARLRDPDSLAPIAGRTVTFSVGTVAATAVTDANGVASTTITLGPDQMSGPSSLTVSFAGDVFYEPAFRTIEVTIYLSTSFVIWGGNDAGLKLGQRVNFWGAQWAGQVLQGDYQSNPSFKGLADPVDQIHICQPDATAQSLAPTCWTSKGGQTWPPPISVPAYIEVIVSTAIAKAGSDTYGNIAAAAVLKVDPQPAYGPVPGKPGHGVIVAVIEDAGVFPAPAAVTVEQAQPRTVLPNEQITVEATVSNTSSATAATDVVLSETLDGLSPETFSETLGTIAPGASRTVEFQAVAPGIPARESSESAADYIRRLTSLNGRVYTAAGQVTFTDENGQAYLPVEVSSRSVLTIPVLTLALSGPAVVSPGSPAPYKVRVTNIGSAPATATVDLTMPDGTSRRFDVADLAAGSSFTQIEMFTPPAVEPKGADETTAEYLARLRAADGELLTASAEVAWSDANGNVYGNVGERIFTSRIRVPILEFTAQAPESLLPMQTADIGLAVRNTGGCTAVLSNLVVTNPDGSTTSAPQFVLAAGESTTIETSWQVPQVPERDEVGETDDEYRARLESIDGSDLDFRIALDWSDPAGAVYGPTSGDARSQEILSIVPITLTGPATAAAGSTITYQVTATNVGSAPAPEVDLTVSLPDGSIQKPAVGSLAPGATFQATIDYAVPATQAAGAMHARASDVWTDPGSNAYGPLSASVSTEVERTAENRPPAVDAGPDQEMSLPNTVILSGTASDDGLPGGSTLAVSWSQVSGPAPVVFHDALSATTPATFTVPGTYVLRLTASDSELSASDEVTVVILQRPNHPPRIISEPVTEFVLGAVPTGGGEIVNLAPWTVAQYELNSQPNASWQRDATNTIVTQTINADASFLLSDFNLSNAQMEGTWRVNTGSDDDFIGFVFGYQNSTHFYLFDWKQANQNDGNGFAERGMSLKVFNADSPLTGRDFWPTAGNGTRVRTLYHNTVGWADFTDYQFTLQFYPGEIRIIVKRGTTVLADFTVNDSTYTNGKFGFYNYSQEQVRYSGFRRLSLARGTYTYDVKAVDPDEDPLTYSLDTAPLGMTIDAATGLITWPVTSATAGAHQVTVRVREPSGGFDTQSYTLTILNPNQPPAVNAGDDRLITTGGTASLNGSATDDGFPRNSTLGVSWSAVSGPGTVGFANPSVAATTATFSQSGSYLLRLSATDGELSASDEVAVTVNTAPTVNAGADQSVTDSNTALLNGTVSDDGVPSDVLTILWSQVSGPGVVSFADPGAPATRAIFPGPGTYTLRLTGNDTLHSRTDDVIVTVNASPALNGATLSLVPGNVGPYATGSSQPLRATLRSSAGNPLANYGVQFEVAGPNATAGATVTDASGVAAFSYTGANVGTDTVRAFVSNTAATIESPTVAMAWTQTPSSPPTVQGWIGAPLDGSSAMGLVPVTVGAGVTLTQGTIEYWPAANPSAVTVLAAGTQGGPGATLATLDTTLLANGNYVIRLRATDSNGQELVSQVMITVAGKYKPGRVTLSVVDLTVHAAGIPIAITRRYDSLERHQVGDFGHGWSLEMAGPRLEVSPDYDVTITEPGTGRRVTFNFAPASFGFPFNFLYQPAYTPEAGVYGKLASNGCGMLVRASGGVVCYLSSDPTYRPTVYTYTDRYGVVYTMTGTGGMQSIKDLNGNVLSFTRDGIVSSASGINVPFIRDTQGRIARVTDPAGKHFDYTYDAAGDLTAVELPGIENPVRYEYSSDHLLIKEIDPRGASTSATYYPDGRLESETDRMGHTTQFAYDASTRTTTTTYPDGGVVVRTDNAFGKPVSVRDQLDRITTYTYDANQNRLTRTDALGKTWTYTYDANGNLASTRDPLGNTERKSWDARGRLLTVTDALNQVNTFKYDAAGNPSALQDAIGQLAAVTYDTKGNQTSVTLPSGRSAQFSYDARGNVTGLVDHSGMLRTQQYDEHGHLVSMSDSVHGPMTWEHDDLGNTTLRRDSLGNTLTYDYDSNGNRTGERDANGGLFTHEYDAADRHTAMTYPDGSRVEVTYDYAGRPLTRTDGEGNLERYVWDKAGQLTSITSAYGTPSAVTTTYTYDPSGRLNSVTDARNATTVLTYDDAGRVKTIRDPAGRSTTFTYDAKGQTLAVLRADGLKRESRYDARGRTTSLINPDGSTVQLGYDGMFLRSYTTEDGKTVSYTYDEHSQVASVTDPGDHVTRYERDEIGNITSVIDANGHETRYEYDGEDRLARKILPDGSFEEYTYDKVGNVVAVRLTDGNVNHLAWDSMDRLVRVDYFDGKVVTFTYSATGQRLTAAAEAGVTRYEYDDLDRLVTVTQPNGVVISYGYDAANNITSITTPRGVTRYVYDVLDRLTTVTDPAGGETTYTYDLGGRLTKRQLPNGVISDYVYDSLDRLTSVAHHLGAAAAFESFVYTFSPEGQRLSVQEAGGKRTSWTYDDAFRLIRESVVDGAGTTMSELAFAYDQGGNRISMTGNGITTAYQYNELDQLTSAGPAQYTYDGRGNLVRVTEGASTTTYSYDAANRLVSAVMPNGQTASYGYDADGRLVSETAGGQVRGYAWDVLSELGDIVYETDSSGSSIAYAYGADGELVQRLGATGSYYVEDGLGSIVGLTNSSGAQTDRYRYDAWGVRTLVQGGTANPFGYRGQWTDRTTGLQYLRARHFNPGTGRFLTRDIAAFRLNDPIDLNRYNYAGADPVNAFDPTGFAVALEYGILTKYRSEDAMIQGYYSSRFSETFLFCALNTIMAVAVDGAWRAMADKLIPNPFNRNGTPPNVIRADRTTIAFGRIVKAPLDVVGPDWQFNPATEVGRKVLLAKASTFRAAPRELAWAMSGDRLEKLFIFMGSVTSLLFGIDALFLGNALNGADRCQNHAERKIIRHANPPMNALLSVGASKPICATCYDALVPAVLYYGGCIGGPIGNRRACR